MNENPRVAFFADSYLEVNGAAMTSKRLVAYAEKKGLPFLCIHAGPQTEQRVSGSVEFLSLKRSPLAIPLDEDLAYDPLFQRHTNRVLRRLMEFRPDVIHITGINDVSVIGAYLAWKLSLPLLGSWHTNVHEFAGSRTRKLLKFLPASILDPLTRTMERHIMQGTVLYYRMPQVILSPNQDLVSELGRRTQRESRMMGRGVDPEFFSPAKRTASDGIFRIGSVGRLRAEKNVRVLVDIEKEFIRAGITDFEILVVGEGTERGFLEENLTHGRFTGFLDGEKLAEAYANMDVFLFPSETDAFGNVAQEANASGVPAIVSDKGGPKFIIREGENGFVAKERSDYAKIALELYRDRPRLDALRISSRNSALSRSWDSIFESVYEGYKAAIQIRRKGAGVNR